MKSETQCNHHVFGALFFFSFCVCVCVYESKPGPLFDWASLGPDQIFLIKG